MYLDQYEQNHILPNTLTVKELIEILKKYNQDMKIMTTWEGTFHSLKEENIYTSKEANLIIDCDENFYKKKIMTDEW